MFEFLKFKKDKKPVPSDEILTNPITDAANVILDDLFDDPNATFLSDLGADDLATIIPNMLRDDQVSSDLKTLKGYINDVPYDVKLNESLENDAAAKKNLESYREILSYNGNAIMKNVKAMTESLEYGSVIPEVIWSDPEYHGGRWVVDRLEPLDHERYGFNLAGQIVDTNDSTILDTPYKYLAITHDMKNGNPHGNSMLLNAYWPWMFKKAAVRSGVMYLKKAILPSLIAIYKAAADKSNTKEAGELIAAQLSKLNNSSGVAMTNVESVQSIGVTSKGNDLVDLTSMFNGMISKAILGTSTLTNDSKYSNRGDSNNLDALVKSRAREIAQTEYQQHVNTLFRWTIELNQPGVDIAKLPYFFYANKYDPSFEEVMKVIESGQAPVSKSWFFNKFAITAPENEEDEAGKPAPQQQFSASNSSNDAFFLQKHPLNAHSMTIETLKSIRKNSAKQ